MLFLVPFFDAKTACAAVPAIFKAGIIPSGMEFMERDALLWAKAFTGDETIPVADTHQAHLLIELDGFDQDQLMREAEQLFAVLEAFETDEILFADSAAQKAALWNLRRKVGEAVKTQSVYKEEDTVVPRFQLPNLLEHVKKVGDRYGFKSVCYGHAGDGNLHVNIIKGDMSDANWNTEVPKGIREIFELTVQLKGTLSGEHGIGLVQKNYMDIAFSKVHLELMERIKAIFDPNNVLNPGKIFPDEA